MGARALAKAIGENTKLISLDLSSNSFTNDTVEILTNSLTQNKNLNILNLSGNQIFCRYDTKIKEDSSSLIVGREAIIYRMLTAAATSQGLKILKVERKDGGRLLMKSASTKKSISFMSNVHTRCLKMISSRISPIALVCAVLKSVKIVTCTANLTVNDNQLSDEQPG